jgi:hypothetical protein
VIRHDCTSRSGKRRLLKGIAISTTYPSSVTLPGSLVDEVDAGILSLCRDLHVALYAEGVGEEHVAERLVAPRVQDDPHEVVVPDLVPGAERRPDLPRLGVAGDEGEVQVSVVVGDERLRLHRRLRVLPRLDLDETVTRVAPSQPASPSSPSMRIGPVARWMVTERRAPSAARAGAAATVAGVSVAAGAVASCAWSGEESRWRRREG